MEPPSQGIFRYFPLRKAHFFTPPLPFPTSLRNSWVLNVFKIEVELFLFVQLFPNLPSLLSVKRCIGEKCLTIALIPHLVVGGLNQVNAFLAKAGRHCRRS